MRPDSFDFLCDNGRDDIIAYIQKLIDENESLRLALDSSAKKNCPPCTGDCEQGRKCPCR